MNLYCIELGDDSNELGGSFCGKWIPGGAFSLRSIRYGVWFPDLKMQTEIFSPAGRCLVDNKEVELGSAKKKRRERRGGRRSIRVLPCCIVEFVAVSPSMFRIMLSLLSNVSLFSNGKTYCLLCITLSFRSHEDPGRALRPCTPTGSYVPSIVGRSQVGR